LLRAKAKFFSAYSPGISGIPNLEEKRTEKLVKKSCSFGDSNVILRNVLDLLRTSDPPSISQIEEWMSSIVGPIRLIVDHDPARDAVISASATVNNHTVPLELLGTGYLQLIQIFAYILLLRPRILLLDEPDTHLNPKVQERLVPLLAEIASRRNLKVLMTTHSPFIVRGGTLNANVAWLSDGQVISSDTSKIQKALGWGAMGKRILIKTEDNNITMLTKILAQWPDLERQVAIIPGEGFKTLPTPKQASEFLKAMGETFALVVHRDRDCHTHAEAFRLETAYKDAGAHLWLTKFSDVESYFVDPVYLAAHLGVSSDTAEDFIASAFKNQLASIASTFASQRAEINKQLYSDGGSPVNSAVEEEIKAARGVFGIASGKAVLKGLCQVKMGIKFDATSLPRSRVACEIADDLRLLLTDILEQT
jgi:energy-coupling factor transporter ATP-binding protein EcfA2